MKNPLQTKTIFPFTALFGASKTCMNPVFLFRSVFPGHGWSGWLFWGRLIFWPILTGKILRAFLIVSGPRPAITCYFYPFRLSSSQRAMDGRFYRQLQGEQGKRPIYLVIEPLDESADNYSQRLKRLLWKKWLSADRLSLFWKSGSLPGLDKSFPNWFSEFRVFGQENRVVRHENSFAKGKVVVFWTFFLEIRTKGW